jgi:hypothetical protein
MRVECKELMVGYGGGYGGRSRLDRRMICWIDKVWCMT